MWKLDRLGRSIKEILTLADELHHRGIGLRTILYSDHGPHHVSVSDDTHIAQTSAASTSPASRGARTSS